MGNNNNKVIVYDKNCNLCNRAINFVSKHDKQKQFRFVPFGSDEVNGLIKSNPSSTQGPVPVSVNLIENNKLYTKSTAVIRILFHLKNSWKLSIILLVIPRFIRDSIYDFISANRYRCFGN